MLKISELEKFANEFLKTHFNLSLKIPIKYNSRLTSTHGRFIRRYNKPYCIELSARIAQEETDNFTLDTLKHELVHYALFLLGKPYKDSDKYFQTKCIEVGAPLTRTRKANIKRHVYKCSEDCSVKHEFDRRLQKRYVYSCKKCKTNLTYQYFG